MFLNRYNLNLFQSVSSLFENDFVDFVKILFDEIRINFTTIKKKIRARIFCRHRYRWKGKEARAQLFATHTRYTDISCACRKGGQVANRAAREGDRDRHPETFITFGFKGAHCAVNGVPRVPSFLLSRSYVPWIRSILRRLPFRESVKRQGRAEGADVR